MCATDDKRRATNEEPLADRRAESSEESKESKQGRWKSVLLYRFGTVLKDGQLRIDPS